MASALRHAARPAGTGRGALLAVAEAYVAFAARKPTLYEAMFTMPTGLRFAETDTRPELRDAFEALAEVIASHGDVGLVTETLWAALHGLAQLEASGRIRPGASHDRLRLLVKAFLRP